MNLKEKIDLATQLNKLYFYLLSTANQLDRLKTNFTTTEGQKLIDELKKDNSLLIIDLNRK